jgi:biotin carboxylase
MENPEYISPEAKTERGSYSPIEFRRGPARIPQSLKKKPTILVHEGPTGHALALKVVRCLAAAGIFLVEAASEQADSNVRFSRWVKKSHVLSSSANSPEGMSQLKKIIQQRKIDVLLPIIPGEIASVMEEDSELRSLVRLPTQPSAKDYHYAGDKEQLSLFLEKHAIPHPRTLRYEIDRDGFRASLETVRFPLIAKPSSSRGGTGVRRTDDPKALFSYLEANSQRNIPFIVQEFIEGRDYGCGVWCSEGEILYHTLYKRCHSDGDSVQPFSGLIFEDAPPVMAIARSLMKKLRWNGIAQIDFRVDQATGGVFVLEINPRFWATVVGSMRLGVNFPELACRQAMGLPLPSMRQTPGRYVTLAGSLSYMKRVLLSRKREAFPGFRDNGLYEVFLDPLPVIHALGGRISRHLARILK